MEDRSVLNVINRETKLQNESDFPQLTIALYFSMYRHINEKCYGNAYGPTISSIITTTSPNVNYIKII